MQFNLLDKPWIPCLGNDKNPPRIGVREALTQAGTIRQIAATNPMDRIAILRFLLALLYWCKGNPPADTDIPSDGLFPSSWFAKLDQHRDCFNLLGGGKRFYQDKETRRSRPVTDLIQEIPTGNNFWHFRHSTDNVEGLCFACCALGLLRLPLFSVSGLPNLRAGINGTPPIYVVPWGNSLLETLLLNWTEITNFGVPSWIDPNISPGPGRDVPVLIGLTVLSRRVWLHDSHVSRGVCINCGTMTTLVRTCEFQTAGEQKNDLWNDPHVVYLDKKPRKALIADDLTAAGKFRMDRPWPNLVARMVETEKFGARTPPVKVLVVGFSTAQAKNIDAWERTIEVKSTVQPTAVSFISTWQKESQGLVRQLNRVLHRAREKGSSRKQPVEVVSALAAVRPHIEGKVAAKAGELLAGGGAAWQEAADEYRPMMEVVARSLSPGFTTAAVQRRREIASALPDMRPSTGQAKTAIRNKTARKEAGAG